nr:MAG TPA: NlpC/P60 family [Caudoviricetes sp.]
MYVTDLIGKPFSEMKCWDLVREYYKRAGKELPDYKEFVLNGETYSGDLVREIQEPVPGCICVYSLKCAGIDHVGIYLGNNKMIHATEKNGVCIEPYSRYIRRLKGLYK